MEVIERFEPAMPLKSLVESHLNTRKRFNAGKLQELADSIREKGIITPLLARPMGVMFEIAAGHRRYRAAGMAGRETVPVVIRELGDDEFLEILTVENLQREDVHPLEEAEGYAELLGRTGYDATSLALKIGKSESYVVQRLKLLDLTKELREEFLEGDFNFSHALLLARLGPENQVTGRKCLYGPDGQAVSVTQLRRQIKETIYLDLHQVPWNVHDEELVPEAGSCTACPKRTGFHPALFPELGKREDYCEDGRCFEAKLFAFIELKVKTVAEQSGKAPLRVSTNYCHNDNKSRAKGVLYSGEWRPMQQVLVTGTPERCGKTQVAVVVESNRYGSQNYVLGQRLEVCTDRKCGHHWAWQTPQKAPESTEEKLEQLHYDRDRAVKKRTEKETTSTFFDCFSWPLPLALARDLVFANLEEAYDLSEEIALVGLELPVEITLEKELNKRTTQSLEWLKSELGMFSANAIGQLVVKQLLDSIPQEDGEAVIGRHLGEGAVESIRRSVEQEVLEEYREREEKILNPPAPEPKKKVAKKKDVKK